MLEIIDALKISKREFAAKTGISEKELNGIIRGKEKITEEIANSIYNFYDVYSPKLWLAFQTGYDEDMKKLVNRDKEKKPKREKYILPDGRAVKK